jgi:SAM-dependent methyltransferase
MMQPFPPPPSDDSTSPKDGSPTLSDVPSERLEKLIMVDSAEDLLHRDSDFAPPFVERRVIQTLESLPLKDSSVDCVISNLALHWINDLPGIMVQINRSLVPDGLFLAAMLGGDTLFELRGSVQLAEQERKGGVSPHISPMASIQSPCLINSRCTRHRQSLDASEFQTSHNRCGRYRRSLSRCCISPYRLTRIRRLGCPYQSTGIFWKGSPIVNRSYL